MIEILSVYVICRVVINDDINRCFGRHLVITARNPMIDEREEIGFARSRVGVWLSGYIKEVDHRSILLVSDFPAMVDVDVFDTCLFGDVVESERAR
ncbi:hypothetical protein C451_05650 [Halococcus thailandensis JCM 13552]|uniref:Uncharacterized protein n=1 Tax=Halococcus thailandensis JCM 13552 TaxID=1227457 RepID=M0NBM9_9EURY|nr:hypothetical protein C451_05650 [Halococcus thailandensis JCM 13552]